MFFDRLNFSQLPRQTLQAIVIGICGMALVACGGGGGGGVAVEPKPADPPPVVSKPAELSLVAGTIQTINGSGAHARITAPDGVALDSLGNAYVTQPGMHAVRKVSPAGVVTVLAGDPVNSGSADGMGVSARFKDPTGVSVDGADNVYVLDKGNYTVRKITPAGLVTTFAGSPGIAGVLDGKGAAARFGDLTSIAADPTGGVFVGDTLEYKPKLRKIAVDGSVTTLELPQGALGGYVYLAADTAGNLFIQTTLWPENRPLLHKLTPAGVLTQVYAFADVSSFGGMALDPAGNVYLSNNSTSSLPGATISRGNTILKLSPQGVLTTIAGQMGEVGSADGQGLSARFNQPGGIAADRQGNLVVADLYNNTLRAISKDGVVSTLAGSAPASVDGQGERGLLKGVVGLASDQQGNVVVAEDFALRSLSPGGNLITIPPQRRFGNLALDSRGFMYSSYSSYANPVGSTTQYSRDGVATGKTYSDANALAVDAQDKLYGIGRGGGTLLDMASGKTVADLGGGYVKAFAFDSAGNAYLADRSRSIILKVSPTGAVSTLAGMDSKPGYKDGAGVAAQFSGPGGIAVVGTDVYVADTGNNLIRKISKDGNVTTIAGTPGSLDTVMGQGGRLYQPTYLTAESSTSLLVVADGMAIVRIRLQ